jgi:small-conductance mechanosensitive channel
LAKGYIDGEIQKTSNEQTSKIQREVDEKIEKTTRDELDKLKADWKGDLFGQVAFPVVFAIASIFAAFAVKDILTEILKEQEREKIQKELETKLEEKIVPKAIEKIQDSIRQDIQAIEAYMNWLEYSLLSMTLTQVIDDQKNKRLTNSKEPKETEVLIIEKLFTRASDSLGRISDLKKDDLNLLSHAEYMVCKNKIKNTGLEIPSYERLLKNLRNKSKEISANNGNEKLVGESRYERIDNVVDMRMRLLIDTLSQGCKDETVVERSEREEVISDLLNYLSTDRHQEAEKRVEKFRSEDPLRPWVEP